MNKILDPLKSELGQNQNSNQNYSQSNTRDNDQKEQLEASPDLNSKLIADLPLEDAPHLGKFEFDSLEKVRNRLIDLSRNNNLINFKPSRSLSVLDVSLEALFKKLNNPSKELTIKEHKIITYGELLNYLKFLDQHPQHAATYYGLVVDADGKLLFSDQIFLHLPVVINPLVQKTSIPITAQQAGQFDFRIKKTNKVNQVSQTSETNQITNNQANYSNQSDQNKNIDYINQLDQNNNQVNQDTTTVSLAKAHLSEEYKKYRELESEFDQWDEEEFSDQTLFHVLTGVQDSILDETVNSQEQDNKDQYSKYQVNDSSDYSIKSEHDKTSSLTTGTTSHSIKDLDILDLGCYDFTDPEKFETLQPGTKELTFVVQALNQHAQLPFNVKEYKASLRNNFLRPFMRGLMFSPILALRLLIVNPRARIRFFNQVDLDTPVLNDLLKLINSHSYTFSQYTHGFYLGLETPEVEAKTNNTEIKSKQKSKSSLSAISENEQVILDFSLEDSENTKINLDHNSINDIAIKSSLDSVLQAVNHTTTSKTNDQVALVSQFNTNISSDINFESNVQTNTEFTPNVIELDNESFNFKVNLNLSQIYDLHGKYSDLEEDKPFKLPRLASSLYLGDLQWRTSGQLSKFYSENNKSIREMGAGILYLSLGLLEYVDIDHRNVFAPLFLVPLELVQNRRSNSEPTYTISYTGEDLVENVSLAEKLLKDLNIYLPKLNIKDNLLQEQLKLQQGRVSPFTAKQIAQELSQVENDQTYDLVTYINLVKQVIYLEQLNCAVHEQAYIGTFQFAKQRMYMDLDPSQWPSTARLEDNAVINALFNERTGVKEFEVGVTKSEYDIDNIDNVHEIYPILNEADSSQHSALIDVLQGKNLVIEGPPGSGKSQTITNIIAAAMRQGKKVLFVAEKMAALEVVYRRLHQMGLSDFCLEMHEPHSLRRRVIDSICKRLNTVKRYPPCPNLCQVVQVYEQLKTTLNNYAYGINTEYEQSGFTKQQILSCASYYRKYEFKNGGLGLFNPEVLSSPTQIAKFFNKTNYNIVCGELESFTKILLDLKASLKRQYRYVNLSQVVANFNLELLSRATNSSKLGFTTSFNLEQAEQELQKDSINSNITDLRSEQVNSQKAEQVISKKIEQSLEQSPTSTIKLESIEQNEINFRVKDHLWYGIRARNLTGLDAKEVVNNLYAWQQNLVKIKEFLQQLITSLKAQQSLDQVKLSHTSNTNTYLDPKDYTDTNFLDDFNEFIDQQTTAGTTSATAGLVANLGIETESNDIDSGITSPKFIDPLASLTLGREQAGFSGFGREKSNTGAHLTGISAHNQGHTQTLDTVITDQDQGFKQLATNLELAQLDLHSLEIFAQNFAQLPVQNLSEILDFTLISKLLQNPIQAQSLFQQIEQDLLSLDRTLKFNDAHLNELINFAYLQAVCEQGEQAQAQLQSVNNINTTTFPEQGQNLGNTISHNIISGSGINEFSNINGAGGINTASGFNGVNEASEVNGSGLGFNSASGNNVDTGVNNSGWSRITNGISSGISRSISGSGVNSDSNIHNSIIAKLNYTEIEFNRGDICKVYGFSERQQLLTNPYVAKLFETVRKHFELLHRYVYNPSSLSQLEQLTQSLYTYQQRESENQRTVDKFMTELSKCLMGKLSLNYQDLVNLSSLLEQLPPELVKYRHACLVSPAFGTHFGELEKTIAKLNYEFNTLNMEYDLGEINDYADFCKLRDAILNKPGFFIRLFDSNYKAEYKRYLNVCHGIEYDDLTNERIFARIESYFMKIEELNQNQGFAQFFGDIYQGLATNMKQLYELRLWADQVSTLCRNEINNSALSPILIAQLSDTDYFNLVELGRLIRLDFERLHQALTDVNKFLVMPITSYDSMNKFAQQAIPGCNLISKLLVKDFSGVNLDKLLCDGIDLYYQAQQHKLSNEFQSSLISATDLDTLANYEMSLVQMHDLVLAGVYNPDFNILDFIQSPAYQQIFGTHDEIDVNQFISGVDANLVTSIHSSTSVANGNSLSDLIFSSAYNFTSQASTSTSSTSLSGSINLNNSTSHKLPIVDINTPYVQQIIRNIKRLINEKPAVLNIAVNWYITQQLIELAHLLASIKSKYGSALDLEIKDLITLISPSTLGKTLTQVLEKARKHESVVAKLVEELGDLDLSIFSGQANLILSDTKDDSTNENINSNINASTNTKVNVNINSNSNLSVDTNVSTDTSINANVNANSNVNSQLATNSDALTTADEQEASQVITINDLVNTNDFTNSGASTSTLSKASPSDQSAVVTSKNQTKTVDLEKASVSLGLFADLLSVFAHCPSWRNLQAIQSQMTALETNITTARQSYTNFKEYTDLEDSLWLGKHTNSIVDLIIRNQLALDCEDALIQWLDYLHATRRLFELKVGRISYFAEHVVSLEIHTLCDIFNQVFFNYLASLVITSTPVLKDFSSMHHNALIQKFNQADDNLKIAQRVHAAYKIDSNVNLMPGNFSRKPAELTEMALLNYMKDHRNLRASLRDILYRAGNSIQSLKPCFMMSPASVAQYLTPGCVEFDLMVMDEASQVTPEDALGAIARCKQVVIVGDPKQLPPTNFFGRNALVDDDSLSVTETAESILDVATTMFPTRVLRWHYRSQHQSLIAFSNQQYYDSRLVIFPSPYTNHPQYGVKYHYVNGAFTYKKGNPTEARVLAQAISQHLLSNTTESLGVVAMNVRQADLIERELDKLMTSNPDLLQAIETNNQSSEPLFIKNLENVQGDERDVIMISCTYGPTKIGDSKVPQRFGPINGKSGSKRLNVLFTRSKRRMEVFSSMHFQDIQYNPSRTESGINDFYAFLKYAETGILTDTDLEQVPEQELEQASQYQQDKISSAIKEMLGDNYQVDRNIGVTGYKLDMAFTRRDSNSYILGLETDGQSYVQARSARDRDRLRGMVLNRLGWKLERLWTMDWFKYSHAEIVTDLKHMLDQL